MSKVTNVKVQEKLSQSEVFLVYNANKTEKANLKKKTSEDKPHLNFSLKEKL